MFEGRLPCRDPSTAIHILSSSFNCPGCVHVISLSLGTVVFYILRSIVIKFALPFRQMVMMFLVPLFALSSKFNGASAKQLSFGFS